VIRIWLRKPFIWTLGLASATFTMLIPYATQLSLLGTVLLAGFALSGILTIALYGFVPALLIASAFVFRTHFEDEMLQKELKGYKEYTRKVRYRLVPGIW